MISKLTSKHGDRAPNLTKQPRICTLHHYIPQGARLLVCGKSVITSKLVITMKYFEEGGFGCCL